MSPGRLTRKQAVVAIAVAVALLHFAAGPGYRGPMRAFVRGYLIDILLPFAMYLLLSLVERPRLSRLIRAAAVVGVGVTVEVLQFFGVPVFGRTFDPLDFAMYAGGVLAAVVFERWVLSKLG